MSDRIDRRRFLRGVLGIAATAPFTLTGCEELIQGLGEACPEDLDESGGVTWTPDVMHPVFYGFKDLSEVDGAPGVLRMWYPTYEGFVDGPPILKLCLTRYPVVLFLHGQEPCPDPDYHTRWTAICSVLARSGYVVVAPRYTPSRPNETNPPNASYALEVLDWVRSGWSERKWVDRLATSTAVVGHSYGALLGARVVGLRDSISAFVGLGGPWEELDDAGSVIRGLTLPKLLMWGRGLFFEDLDRAWDVVPAPKHGVDYDGEHFDYIPAQPNCSKPRGPCEELQFGTADLVALFLARYLPVQPNPTTIPVDLEPASAPLTQEQQFYAGGRLAGLDALTSAEGCSVDLRWEDGTELGTRTIAS